MIIFQCLFRHKLARSVLASLVRIVGHANIESRVAYVPISDHTNNNRTRNVSI